MRREGSTIRRRYCHIGTGNYNPKTGLAYEDVFAPRPPRISARDPDRSVQPAHRLLAEGQLPQSAGGAGIAPKFEREREVEAHSSGPARAESEGQRDVDEQIIDGLYRASLAGVR